VSPWRAVSSIVVLTGLLGLVAGCGARWSNAQHAAVLARAAGAGTSANGGSAPGASARGAATTIPGAAVGGVPGVVGSSAAASASGPSAASGAAPGAATGGSAAALPCSAPSNAPGVTNTTITVGNIATLTGPVPGLGASGQGATQAYVAYLNANGGVCGRKVVLKTADDADDNGQYRSILNAMAPHILGLTGISGGGDAGGADIVAQQNIPTIVDAFSTPMKSASPDYPVNPPYGDESHSIGKYKWYYQQGVRTAALVYIDVAQSADQVTLNDKPLMQAAGIKVVSEQALPLSTLNYDSAARTVANSHADYLFFLGGYEENSSMATSMAGTGYHLKYAEYYTTYGTNFIDLAGSAAEGTVSWSYSLPVEDGGTNPEQAKFLQWMAQVAPNAPLDVFADQAWVATHAFFMALQQLPGPISRDALLKQFRTYTSFDADGFYGRIDLGQKINIGCYIGMQVVGGHWKRMVPAQGFLC
jgi:ABC-type branched-subunit amino acid transport system substrate-binding protein